VVKVISSLNSAGAWSVSVAEAIYQAIKVKDFIAARNDRPQIENFNKRLAEVIGDKNALLKTLDLYNHGSATWDTCKSEIYRALMDVVSLASMAENLPARFAARHASATAFIAEGTNVKQTVLREMFASPPPRSAADKQKLADLVSSLKQEVQKLQKANTAIGDYLTAADDDTKNNGNPKK
jgi:hypothetical protein